MKEDQLSPIRNEKTEPSILAILEVLAAIDWELGGDRRRQYTMARIKRSKLRERQAAKKLQELKPSLSKRL